MSIKIRAQACCDRCGSFQEYWTLLRTEFVPEQTNYDSVSPPEVRLDFDNLPEGWRTSSGYGGSEDLCPKCSDLAFARKSSSRSR